SQGYALLISAEDRQVVMLDFHGKTVFVQDTGLPKDAATISLSSSGKSAALFYPSARQIYVASELPHAPRTWIADRSTIRNKITTVSVSDDGRSLLAGTQGGQIYLFNQNGQPELIANLTLPVLSSFLRNSHDAVIADESEKRLYYFSESSRNTWNVGQ